MKVELSPEALALFHEIQSSLRAANPKRARAFTAEMRRIGRVLRRFPRSGTPIREFRRMLLQRFPYSILYVVEGDRVWITSIEQQKREPDYWADDDDE